MPKPKKVGRPVGSCKGRKKIYPTVSEDNFEWLCAQKNGSRQISRIIDESLKLYRKFEEVKKSG